VTWNRENTVLDPGEDIAATITLDVASDTGTLSNFSFNIIITGTE
jgi:hypothetical protein